MGVITKSWTNILDTAVDPDSPGNTALFTALRDNVIHVREWLGASFIAGAVQDHSHDGVDSALIEAGANALRNGSFESGEAAWTFTDYAGGSHAVSTSAHRHGAKSITFTSTSTANGGGEAISNAYLPIAEGDTYSFKAWVWASVANISSKIQVVWYDNGKSQISTSDLYITTDTPTSATLQGAVVVAPSNARWARLKLIGGVPGSGSATGTTRFDGVTFADLVPVNGTYLVAASVAQGHLKATYGDVSSSSNPGGSVTLAGGSYGFFPQIYSAGGFATASLFPVGGGTQSTSPVTIAGLGTNNASFAAYARQYYVQASPPYDLGNGAVPLFTFAALDGSGSVLHTYCAPDPPWANNGPTDIRADYYRGTRAYQRRRNLPRMALRGTPAERLAFLQAWRDAPVEEIEITQTMKQADMSVIPHPFLSSMADVAAVVLLDPVGAQSDLLHELHRSGESIATLLGAGYLQIDNTPLVAAVPPGVQAARWRWKNT